MARITIDTDKGPYQYETDGCLLLDPDGNRVDLSMFGYREYLDGEDTDNGQPVFSLDEPLIGKEQPTILKIQLGLGCNYSCSYCSQGGQAEDKTSTDDALRFVENLDSWLKDAPDKIELWGGEPLLYWRKIRILAPALRYRFPRARMSLITNGSLLTREKARFLHELGFSLAVSHDGPGQAVRGADPFADSEWTTMIREVAALFGDSFSFNTVITPGHYDLFKLIMWFETRMGEEPVKVNIENVATDYGGAPWPKRELQALEAAMREQVGNGLAFMFPRIRWAAQQFLGTLAIRKPLAGSHQVCSMDKKDYLAVDLNGQVLTCQNSGASSGHAIGRVERLEDVALRATPWSARPHCGECPVVHLCYGSCMLINNMAANLSSACAASYHYNMGILAGLIKRLTGAEVRSVSGHRPSSIVPIVAIQ